jgi:outer membrane receptor protein involved in Fe transport
LFYLFEGPTSSYGSVTDWYQCRLAGYSTKNISQCPLAGQASPLIISSGSTGLKDVTAKSYTTGFVWSPLENRLRLSVDYSRVDISNEVQQINLDTLLQTEADCRIGSSEAGQPYNINSPTCQNALALVQRGASGITQITSVPINIALEHEAGIQSEARYSWPTRLLGRFSVDARYFRQLQHTTKNFPGDAPLNLLCCNNNDEFFNTLSLDFVWKIGKSATTLHGTRYAPTWNDAGTARDLGPWVVINGSERYAVARGMFLELIVNNIFNRQPPYDPTNGSYPYYDTGSYNGYGRAYWVEFGAKFGGKGP